MMVPISAIITIPDETDTAIIVVSSGFFDVRKADAPKLSRDKNENGTQLSYIQIRTNKYFPQSRLILKHQEPRPAGFKFYKISS